MARLMIVDDHPIFLSGLIDFLSLNGHDIVASSRTRADALARFADTGPEIVIADYSLPDGSGLDLVADLQTHGASAPTIILTAQISAKESRSALSLGVNGLILKESDPQIILRCIESVMLGHRWIDNKIMEAKLIAEVSLTRAEEAVAALVADGLRNREIAETLNIAEGTVKVHVHSILKKMGVKSRTALARAFPSR
jgi:DNA-binding NarL/FixJ family response regulator